MALNLSPHCLNAPGELGQRDAHQEGRSPEGIGPWGAGAEPVELARPPWSQAAVVTGALG